MANIIAFRRKTETPEIDNRTALFEAFADYRRADTDVFWLKENAELLGIFAAMDVSVPEAALSAYAPFYDAIEEKLRFFPQYYRFLLSICLDLEALGMPGDKAEALCQWVQDKGFAEAELSDLQRAEARRLLSRRDASGDVTKGALGARLHRFIGRSETFAMPNKKAAYELTHIVFYLSEYGRRDPQLDAAVMTSLEFAGVLAYLDQNMDLLAEVCIAIRFAGGEPSPIWAEAVSRSHSATQITSDTTVPGIDCYHEYFVTGWGVHVLGRRAFDAPVPAGPVRFQSQPPQNSALRLLSTCLCDLGPARSGDWDLMRGHVLSYLGQSDHDVLLDAEQSTDKFGAFFEGFARAARV